MKYKLHYHFKNIYKNICIIIKYFIYLMNKQKQNIMNTLELLKSELKGCNITEGKLFFMITYKTEKQLSKINNVLYVLGLIGQFMNSNNVVTIKK